VTTKSYIIDSIAKSSISLITGVTYPSSPKGHHGRGHAKGRASKPPPDIVISPSGFIDASFIFLDPSPPVKQRDQVITYILSSNTVKRKSTSSININYSGYQILILCHTIRPPPFLHTYSPPKLLNPAKTTTSNSSPPPSQPPSQSS
jgi:hypothetical protein